MSTTEQQRDIAAGPYAGLTVIELATDPAGEMTGMQFVHQGATVVKVEPPDGSPSRRSGPFAGDVADVDASLAYWYYNGGKRSVVADLATDEGKQSLDALVSSADLVISTLHPLELERLGLDLHAIAAAHPSLILLSITPFGLTGPWSHYLSSDLIALATSGLLITSGYDDHSIPPIRPGGDQAFHTAASFAHIAALLALVERDRSGAGGVIDVSVQEAAGLTVELANPYWFYPRGLVERQTCRHAQPVPTQPAIFQCGDGRWVYFALILADQKPWQAMVSWMDSEGLAADLVEPEYDSLEHRQANFAHVQDVVECFFLLLDSSVAYHEGQARGLPIGILNAPEDLYHDEHLVARGFFADVEQPGHGVVPHPVAAYRFSSWQATPPQPAARLGEHTAEVLGAIRGGER